jgi:serine/threonine protein kinase
VLRPDWEDQPVATKLLQREARAGLAVKHPHLVTILDTHALTSPFYIVMAYLSGESLRRRLRREYRLDVSTALWIVRQTAQAVAALHRKGFIHADIKPENIRLADAPAAGQRQADGARAILLDLGFTHRPGENAPFRDLGYVLGTVNYLAPELCGNEPGDDPRADIFSLGVTLFEMLTGQLPYPAGAPLDTMRCHHSDEPKLLTDVLPEMPAEVTELVDRMLSREPHHRPTAERLVQDLIHYEIASLGQRRAA